MPQSQKQAVIEGCHSDAFGGGHFGRDKTYFKVTERFYWNGIMKDIKSIASPATSAREQTGKLFMYFR